MTMETYWAMSKIKLGKAPGVCGIYPEYTWHGGNDALHTLHKIFTRVWEEEVVPEEWHQGIIIPLYKGKGSKSDCCNYRGITLLSAPGSVCTLHSCENKTKPAVAQTSSTELVYTWSLNVRSCSYPVQHCTAETGLWPSNFCSICWSPCHLWFSEQTCTLATADKAWYPGQDS